MKIDITRNSLKALESMQMHTINKKGFVAEKPTEAVYQHRNELASNRMQLFGLLVMLERFNETIVEPFVSQLGFQLLVELWPTVVGFFKSPPKAKQRFTNHKCAVPAVCESKKCEVFLIVGLSPIFTPLSPKSRILATL